MPGDLHCRGHARGNLGERGTTSNPLTSVLPEEAVLLKVVLVVLLLGHVQDALGIHDFLWVNAHRHLKQKTENSTDA